jgi:hypothetical protein
MKIAMNLVGRTCLIVSIFSVLSQAALAFDNFKDFHRDHWDWEVNGQYFYSEANYDNGGNHSSLTSGNHYQLIDTSLQTRYMRKDSSFFGAINIGNAEAKDSVSTRSNSVINWALAGYDFVAYSDAVDLVPEFTIQIPFERVDPSSDSTLTSEGVWQATGRLIAQKNMDWWRLYGWLGLQYRGEGRSYLLPWGVGLHWQLEKVLLGVELFGYQSITDDKDTGNNATVRNAFLNTVDAGSYKFYSVNPSVVDSQVYLTWLVNREWSLQVNGGTTLAGANMAEGFHVGGFVRMSFDMTDGYSTIPRSEYQPQQQRPVVPVTPVPAPMEATPPPPPVHQQNNGYNNGKSRMYKDEMSEQVDVGAAPAAAAKKFKEDTNDGVDQSQFQRKNKQSAQSMAEQKEFKVGLKPDTSVKKKKKKKKPQPVD